MQTGRDPARCVARGANRRRDRSSAVCADRHCDFLGHAARALMEREEGGTCTCMCDSCMSTSTLECKRRRGCGHRDGRRGCKRGLLKCNGCSRPIVTRACISSPPRTSSLKVLGFSAAGNMVVGWRPSLTACRMVFGQTQCAACKRGRYLASCLSQSEVSVGSVADGLV